MAATTTFRGISVAIALAIAIWIAPAAPARSRNRQPPDSTPVRVVRVAGPSAFNWTDAAIGGAAVLALVVIGVGLRAVLTDNHDGPRPTTVT